VEFNGVVHFAFDTISGRARGNATREIGRIGGIAGGSFLNNDQVATHFNPACFRILFCVPGARSSPGFPAMVTTPFYDGGDIAGGCRAFYQDTNHLPRSS